MSDFTPIDNPAWFALTGVHQPLAKANGLARRYPTDVSPLGALREPAPPAFADMNALVGLKERVGLFTIAPVEVPETWETLRTMQIDQMVCTELSEPAASATVPLLPLQPGDSPEMLALVAATEPGPFLPRTIAMGRYFGIRSNDGRLVAMAGERLRLDGFTEISAVCTNPEFRGKGYARLLVTTLVRKNLAEGKIPFLHMRSDNDAKFVYEKVGFRFRRFIFVTMLTPR